MASEYRQRTGVKPEKAIDSNSSSRFPVNVYEENDWYGIDAIVVANISKHCSRQLEIHCYKLMNRLFIMIECDPDESSFIDGSSNRDGVVDIYHQIKQIYQKTNINIADIFLDDDVNLVPTIFASSDVDLN